MWTKNSVFSIPINQTFPESDFSKYSDFSPVEIFELFFDAELFHIMFEEIKKYAAFKNIADPNITIDEIKCFLGILTISGYNSLPGVRYYWESAEDTRNQLIYNSMRRNRFIQILNLLHFADNNNINPSDKLW